MEVINVLEVEDVPAIKACRSIELIQLRVFRKDILIIIDIVQIDCLGPGVVCVEGELIAEAAGHFDL